MRHFGLKIQRKSIFGIKSSSAMAASNIVLLFALAMACNAHVVQLADRTFGYHVPYPYAHPHPPSFPPAVSYDPYGPVPVPLPAPHPPPMDPAFLNPHAFVPHGPVPDPSLSLASSPQGLAAANISTTTTTHTTPTTTTSTQTATADDLLGDVIEANTELGSKGQV